MNDDKPMQEGAEVICRDAARLAASQQHHVWAVIWGRGVQNVWGEENVPENALS